MNSAVANMSTLKQFSPFPRLPQEVRRAIWTAAVHEDTRIIRANVHISNLDVMKENTDSSKQETEIICYDGFFSDDPRRPSVSPYASDATVRHIGAVCREAQRAVLVRYPDLLVVCREDKDRKRMVSRAMRVNLKTDTFLVPSIQTFCSSIERPSEFLTAIWQQYMETDDKGVYRTDQFAWFLRRIERLAVEESHDDFVRRLRDLPRDGNTCRTRKRILHSLLPNLWSLKTVAFCPDAPALGEIDDAYGYESLWAVPDTDDPDMLSSWLRVFAAREFEEANAGLQNRFVAQAWFCSMEVHANLAEHVEVNGYGVEIISSDCGLDEASWTVVEAEFFEELDNEARIAGYVFERPAAAADDHMLAGESGTGAGAKRLARRQEAALVRDLDMPPRSQPMPRFEVMVTRRGLPRMIEHEARMGFIREVFRDYGEAGLAWLEEE